ncbi:hydroxymethylpyrimidine/phosphomethylpyrimidine kinase [Arthrobacter sp. V4I6]|uniref:bifunctional hydroxymethylpyrimidine kinase/phosphomethylpyrimidine kinase n=1 Tax=unclassified Arthrobacter TaxID=235627 RepID=UPI002787B1CC|nr:MULTISPECIES: bifunctional hydroxymethylpyrimidine kinase/phosphomethylpyrimidine kinase [unclassified Arthrobacter]MDQ0820659.1 hydroxymethylpyrimidine/phosphomethylpyrimidine kinase [Arthrobacter sp. V1I7]MDQ0854918.1 hydroxymethylpyrimidine/phosphomethylpyrimidine kinase [Arthrobacter sp. V4I6]
MSIVASVVLPSAFLPPAPTTAPARIPRVLAIAGSDPSGGAGIQADLKSIAAHGGYGMAAITALTAQNTRGVRAVHVPPAAFLTAQLDAVSADIGIDAVKIGMLGDAAVIDAVRRWLEHARPGVVVLDPVMVATSGDRLLPEAAETALHALLPLADLVTPNLAELALLLREPVAADWAEALAQGKRLAALSGTTVLVKGGHLEGNADGGAGAEPGTAGGEFGHDGGCPDALVNTGGLLDQETVVVTGRRVPTSNSHGTGCSLSSALATVQARVGDWEAALREVKPWLEGALRSSEHLDVGTGNGPVHHFHHVQHLTSDHGTTDHGTADHGLAQGPGDRRVPAEGEFVAALGAGAAPDLDEIYGLEFIRRLADGTLPEREFAYYLAQDALYLNGYSRVLARAAALAPAEAEQLFWARSAQQCLEVESELHRSWLSTRTVEGTLGPVTKSYVDHLLAASVSGSYGVLVAAALPCFWLYAVVGAELHAQFLAAGAAEAHPYADWLRTYADEDFAAATRQAIAITDDAARRASAGERDAMALAFRQSARYEVAFFDAPRLHA